MAPETVELSASFVRGSRGSMRLDYPLDCILNVDIEKVSLKKRKSPAGLKTGLNSTTIHLNFDEQDFRSRLKLNSIQYSVTN
jgi:hypothetical protein